MSGKEYLIFDLDGTLVDSMPFWENLATELLHRHGIDQLPADLHDRIQTMTLTDSAVFIQELFALPVTAESLAQEMRALMDQHYRNDIPLKVGVYAYLQNAYQSGRKIVLATASSSVLAKDCLRRLKLLPFFDFVFSVKMLGRIKRNLQFTRLLHGILASNRTRFQSTRTHCMRLQLQRGRVFI